MSMTMHKRTVNETIDMIEMFGTHVTIIGRGDVGVGKSSMLFELSKRFPTLPYPDDSKPQNPKTPKPRRYEIYRNIFYLKIVIINI